MKNKKVKNWVYLPRWTELIMILPCENFSRTMKGKDNIVMSTIHVLLKEFLELGIIKRQRVGRALKITLTKKGVILKKQTQALMKTLKLEVK